MDNWTPYCIRAEALCEEREYAEALALLRPVADSATFIPLRLARQILNLIVFLEGGQAALSEYYRIERRIYEVERPQLMGICCRGMSQGFYAVGRWDKAIEFAHRAKMLLAESPAPNLDLILIGSYGMIGRLSTALEIVRGFGPAINWDRGLSVLIEVLSEAEDFSYIASAIEQERPDFALMARAFIAHLEGDIQKSVQITSSLCSLSENPIFVWNTFYVVANKLRMAPEPIAFIVSRKCQLYEKYKLGYGQGQQGVLKNRDVSVLMLKFALSFFDLVWSRQFYNEVVKKIGFVENVDYVINEISELNPDFLAELQKESDVFRSNLCEFKGGYEGIASVSFDQERITLLMPYRVILGQFNIARKMTCNYVKFCEVVWKQIRSAGEEPLIKMIPFHSADITNFRVNKGVVLSYHSHGQDSSNLGKVVHVMEGPLDGYYTVDSLGYSGWSSVANAESYPVDHIDLAKAELFHASLVREYIEGNKSRLAQDSNALLPEEIECIDGALFFALQMIHDRVAVHTEFPMLQALEIVAQWAKNGVGKVVVKRHPNCRNRTVERALEAAARCGAYVTQASIHRIIPYTKMVLTVNSSVGFEALLHLKPVLTLGKSDYCWATAAIRSGDDLLHYLKNPPAADVVTIKRFLYSYLNEACVAADDDDAISGVVRARLIEPFRECALGESMGQVMCYE